MKRVLLGGAAAIAMFLTAGATAQSADIVSEPVAVTDWSGFYIGAHLGYAWANMSGCYDCSDTTTILDAEELDLEGIVGGLHAGYNWQMDHIVFGIEADVSFTDIDDSEDAPSPDEDESQSGDVDLLASVRARLGVAFDDVLLYATGGIAIPDAEWQGNDLDGDEANLKFGEIGGVVGGGMEYAVTEDIRLRAEGLYYFFDEEESLEGVNEAATGEAIEFDDVFVVRAGVSFYFN